MSTLYTLYFHSNNYIVPFTTETNYLNTSYNITNYI